MLIEGHIRTKGVLVVGVAVEVIQTAVEVDSEAGEVVGPIKTAATNIMTSSSSRLEVIIRGTTITAEEGVVAGVGTPTMGRQFMLAMHLRNRDRNLSPPFFSRLFGLLLALLRAWCICYILLCMENKD